MAQPVVPKTSTSSQLASGPSGNSGPLTPIYRKTIDLDINDFDQIRHRKDLTISSSASNTELKMYGEQLENSRWILMVAPVFVSPASNPNHGSAKKAIVKSLGVYLDFDGSGDITVQNTGSTISILNGSNVNKICYFVEKLQLNVKNGQSDTDKIYHELISHSTLLADGYLEGGFLRIRAEICYKVVSGGDQPGSFGYQLRGDFERGPTDCTVVSSDGKKFPAHRSQLLLCPLLALRMNTSLLLEGSQLPTDFDGETTEAMLESIYSLKRWTPTLSGKLLVAARKYQLESVEARCMKMLTSELTVEKVTIALSTAKKYGISSLSNKVIPLLPEKIKDLTVKNAAAALKIAQEHSVPKLAEKAEKLAVTYVLGFAIAGGFQDIGDQQDLVLRILLSAHRFGDPKLESNCRGPLAENLTVEKVTAALKFAKDWSLPILKEKVIELISDKLKNLSIHNAAAALTTAAGHSVDILRKKAAQVAADDLEEFLKVGGFQELAAFPDLIREIADAVTQRQSKKMKTEPTESQLTLPVCGSS